MRSTKTEGGPQLEETSKRVFSEEREPRETLLFTKRQKEELALIHYRMIGKIKKLLNADFRVFSSRRKLRNKLNSGFARLRSWDIKS